MINFNEQVLHLAELVRPSKQKLTVAESCTGGWLAKVITDLNGSSDWFDRGFVTYSNESKIDMLGVSSSVLEQFGAVSIETVNAMALGALQHSQADLSIAISGIAGPSGGTDEKPVGTVCFAWAKSEAQSAKIIHAETIVFNGDRNSVREQAVQFALDGIIKLL